MEVHTSLQHWPPFSKTAVDALSSTCRRQRKWQVREIMGVGKATVTRGLRLGKSEVLRCLRHQPVGRRQRTSHHRFPGGERRWKRERHKAKDITPSISWRREALKEESAQGQGHHTIDLLEERGVERGSVQRSSFFHIVSGTAPPYLSELFHLYSPSPSLRSSPDTRIFRVPRVCKRTLGERSFQYIGPVIWNSLSLSGMPLHSPLSSQNWKPTSSLLPNDLSFSFFCSHQTLDKYACIFTVCVYVCVCVCVCVCGVCVCVFLKWMCLSAFVSALGSHEMGCYKLPINILLLLEFFQTLWDYNLAWDQAIHTRLMTLTLFQGHRFVRIINCKLFLDSCPL